MSRENEAFGDEDEIQYYLQQDQQMYEDEHADDYKYEEEFVSGEQK